MEDIVAVAITLADGRCRYFLTWGRVFDPVDGAEWESLAMKHSTMFQLGGPAVSARLCESVREAASEPYFFEALFAMAQRRIPFGTKYEGWRRATAKALRSGREWWYLGGGSPAQSAIPASDGE